MVALFAHTAPAQTWVGASGSWSVPSNWNGTAVPTTGGDVLLGVSSTTVTLDVSSAALNSITIGAPNGTTLTVQGVTLTTVTAVIGQSGTGGISQSSGLVTITGNNPANPDLILGATTGAVGTYQLSGGTLLVDIMTVGSGSTAGGTYGTGIFTQSGGVVDMTQSGGTGQLYVGDAAGSDGSYFLQSGSLRAVDEFVGVSSSTSGTHVGQRQFVQSGGTNNLAGSLTIGDAIGAVGSYSLSGASTNVLTVGGNEYIGVSGAGTFTQTGGVNIVNNVSDSTGFLILGSSAGSSGNYNLVAGTLTAGYELIGNGGVGSFSQSTGVNTASQALDVVNGVYTITSGTFTTPFAVIGDSDSDGVAHSGTFLQLGGMVTITGSDASSPDLILGATTGAVGSYQISSGTLRVDIMTVGSGSTAGGTYGTGVFTQSGGVVDLTQSGSAGQLYVGDAAGSDGSYFLQSGSLGAVDEFVGVSSSTSGTHVGQRQFVQSGGTNNLAGSLTIGDASGAVGSYSLSGASTNVLTVGGNEYIGSSGAGTFTQTGGVNTVNNVSDATGFLILGNSAGSSGNYNLVAGTLTAGYELVGNAGVGSFSQSTGVNTASQALDVVNGIYTITSGTFTTPFAVIGDSDSDGVAHSGTFLQLGGLVTITGSDASSPDLILGATTGAVGSYQINSGTLRVDIMTVGSGSTAGGTYGTGVFTQSGGVVDLTQSGSGGQLYVGDAAGSDGSYFLQSGSLRAVDEFVGVSSSTSGTHVGQRQFVQSGGTNNLAGSLTIGDASGAVGSYSLSGAGNSVFRVAGNEFIGVSGAGTFTQTGGVNTVNNVSDSTGFLILGSSAGSSGNYNLVAGTLTAGYELVGNGGVGSFTQSAGLNTASQVLDVVNGVYTMTGGTFTTPFAIIGDSDSNSVGHSGTFSQSGGLVTITGSDPTSPDLVLGATTGAAGSYQISSGTLRVDIMTVGSGSTAGGTYGTGLFTQSGGVVDLTQSGGAGQLYVGDAAGSSGSYNLQSGSLSAIDEFVGVSSSTSGTHVGQREFVQSGGTNSIAGSLTLGDASGATGSYSLSGAATSRLVVAGNEYIGSSGTGTFTQEGGVNTVNTVSDSTGFLVLGAAAGGSGTYNLGAGLLTAGYEVVGNASGGGGVGSFTQQGGTNTVTQALLIDTNSSYTLNGGSLLVTGTGDNTGLDNGSVFNMAGGILGGAGQKLNESNMTGYGTINGGDLVNGVVTGSSVVSTGTVTFQGGLSSVNANVVNNAGSKININSITVFAGSVTNNGTITTNHTNSFFYGSVSGSGAFISDPSTTTVYGAYSLSNPGYISAAAGDKWQFGNDVDITTSNSAQWSTKTAEMDIISGTYTSATVLHSFVYPGLDFGQSNAGYNSNFAWKILSIDDNNYLVNSSGALYVSILELGSASDPTSVAALASNFDGSLDIYYDPSLVANAYLNDQTYAFGSGGGEILPIPEPSTLMLFPVGLLMAVVFWRRRRRLAPKA